jgi:hypothetical protein
VVAAGGGSFLGGLDEVAVAVNTLFLVGEPSTGGSGVSVLAGVSGNEVGDALLLSLIAV